MGFTFRHLKPDDPYFANWQEKRRRTRRLWLALVAWPIVSLALSGACLASFKTDGFPWVVLPATILAAVLSLHLVRWRCPRCGKPFYKTWYSYRPFANMCMHCGLLEYAADGS